MGALYRIRQFILSIGMKFLTQESPKIIEELDRAGQVLEDKDIDRVFVMTTPGFIRRGTLEPLFEDLDKRDISYEIYTDIKPDPSIDDIVDAFAKYDKFSSQAIVGIGGGSILDASKALGAKPDTAIEDMKGTFKVKEDLPLMILVPTTAGTGSEVTVASAVTEPRENEPDYKYSIMDYALLPDYAILDSNLLVTLPSGLSATTGMYALIHEVEAYTNKFGSQDARDDALEATKLIFENLKNSYDHGENLEHRINMLYASHKAGRAFFHNYVRLCPRHCPPNRVYLWT